MNTRNRRGSKLALSILGLAAAVPLLAVSASAGLEGGNFLIRATNADNMSGTAGIGGVGTPGNPGGNPGGPGEGEGPGTDPGETAPVTLATYTCGPVSLEITDKMVEFSKANEALLAQGKADEMVAHPDGWKIIASASAAPYQAGFPEDGSKPNIVKLGEAVTGGTTTASANLNTNGTCSVSNYRAPAENKAYYYSWRKSLPQPTVTEGRWLLEEGQLRKVQADGQADGKSVVYTRPDTKSDKYPTYYSPASNDPDGINMSATFKLPQRVDGTDQIQIQKDSWEDTTIWRYQELVPGNSVPQEAKRTTGPNFVQMYNQSGLMKLYFYIDSNGNKQTVMPTGTTYAAQVADYNARSGQNWDGRLPQLNEFELTSPFLPTAAPAN